MQSLKEIHGKTALFVQFTRYSVGVTIIYRNFGPLYRWLLNTQIR